MQLKCAFLENRRQNKEKFNQKRCVQGKTNSKAFFPRRKISIVGHVYRMPVSRETKRIYETRTTEKYKRRSPIKS